MPQSPENQGATLGAQAARMRAQAMMGSLGTIATSSMGQRTAPSTAGKTLLGQ